MTSKERKESRYQRRKEKRITKASDACSKTFDEVINFENLVKAGKACCNGSRWKASTINYETGLLSECQSILSVLQQGKRRFNGFHSFITIEHGKARNIDALPIQDRTVQKCLCRKILTFAYSRSFIADNAASLPNRGMDYMLKRLKKHLVDHFRKYGLEGGILQFDFKNYFGSLPHDIIKERARKVIWDDKLYELLCSFVDDFKRMRTADPNGDKPRGVGLGSEVSQIIALDYASPIDHYIKDTLGIKGYGRYMDDGYVISNSLEELEEIRKQIDRLANDLWIKMSEKKCIITPFKNHSFVFLKFKIKLEESGRVVIRLSRKTVRAMRKKLNIFKQWYDDGKMDIEDVCQSFQSWRAHALRCDSYNTLCAMDEQFVNMFADGLKTRKNKFKCTLKANKTEDGWIYTKRERKGD